MSGEDCVCGHSVYGHGFYEGDARAGTEEFVNGCTEDDCACRNFSVGVAPTEEK